MGRSALTFGLLLAACTVRRPATQSPDAGHAPAAASIKEDKLGRDFVPCPLDDKQDLDAALDEAARRYDRQDYKIALACADQAARISPRSVEAYHNRADALVALERLDEARDAFALALALDPDDPQTLAGAADLYVNQLGPAHDLLLIGLEYARRGSGHVGRRREDRDLAARLALLEAEALDDLGRADEALPRVEAALRHLPDSTEARYQRALVLFHLCKLDKAREGFEEVLSRSPDDAYAHHHLGLVLERQGLPEAESHFARARALAPSQFPPPVLPSRQEFEKLVEKAVAALDPATRSLAFSVRLEVADLPEITDLVAVDPPFPPTILGLFRGGDEGDRLKSIVFYRKNLARAASTPAELEKQVRVTLLHEIGHMAGADEDELRDRGFE